jgi:hypothetical protein
MKPLKELFEKLECKTGTKIKYKTNDSTWYNSWSYFLNNNDTKRQMIDIIRFYFSENLDLYEKK